jgi:3beta-hydroxy-delta5-steroid dehydrogenase/steroid delta-isomerase
VAIEPRPEKGLDEELGPCLVTGAAGFLGRNLARALLDRGCSVRALVHRSPLDLQHPRLAIAHGDIRDPEAVRTACRGIDTVFHAAATIALLGGRAATPQYRQAAWSVNVSGTENMIGACQAQGVERLVYTSSVDVCFDGKPLPDMNQQTPYAASPKSVYGETKIEAERRVLAANGIGGLVTCSVRPDGIYGPGENLVLDSILVQLARGTLKAAIGSASTRQDNSYIENLVHGEILAARSLAAAGAACGKAYFVSDGEPQNTFGFLRPLLLALGFHPPTRSIPAGLLRPILEAWQYAHFRWRMPPPPLTPHELDKISITHFGSNADAERDLGYRPVKTVAGALEDCVPYCRKKLESLRAERGET